MKKLFIIIGIFMLAVVAGVVILSHSGEPVPTNTTPQRSYVALGDSVAAGVGLKGDSDSSACNRTNQAYPNQAATTLNYKLTNLACSGATLPAGILGKQDVNKLLVTPQIEQLFAHSRPELISLTVGANDSQWTTVIAKCYTGVCGNASDTDQVTTSLDTVMTNLGATLSQIEKHYGNDVPPVIVTGYHQVFPVAVQAGCTDLSGIDTSELAWGRQLQTMLSDTIRSVVGGSAFASYAPVNFSGHELCTADSWVQGLGDKQPYHPTEAGQAEFARTIVTAVRAKK